MKNIKYLIGASIGIVLLVVSYWIILKVFIDEDVILSSILEEVKKNTGYNATADDAQLSVFPAPVITINDFRVSNSKDSASAYFTQAKKIDIHLGLMSIFSSTKRATKIDILNPILELQSFGDGNTNWEFINNLNTTSNIMNFDSINLINGKVNYSREVKGGKYYEFSKIDITLSNNGNGEAEVNGNFGFIKDKFTLNSKATFNSFESIKAFSGQFDVKLKSQAGVAEYHGQISHRDNGFDFNGKLDADFSDISNLVEHLIDEDFNVDSESHTAFPLKILVGLEGDGKNKHALNNISVMLHGMNIVGVGTIENRNKPYLNLKLRGDTLDLNNISSSGNTKESIENIFWNILTTNVNIDIDAELQKLQFSEKLSAKANFQVMIENGEMVVNQSRIDLPGGTKFLSFGIFRPENNKKIQFDGWWELIGKNFNLFSEAIGISKEVSFADHNGSFKSKASVFLSPAQTIVSGLKFKAGNLYLVGGINMKADNKKAAETSLRVSGINLDGIVKYLFPNMNNKENTSGINKDFDSYKRHIPWLDDVTKTSIFEVVLDDFTYKGQRGKPSAVKISISPKSIKAENININLGDNSIRGKLRFVHEKKLPKISGQVMIAKFDMLSSDGYLRVFPVPRGSQIPVWQDVPYDFSFLKGYNTDLKIKIGKFKHNDFEIRNLKSIVIGSVGKIKIEKFSGNIWGGKVKGNGFVDISSIPMFSGSFSFSNIFANKLTKSFASQDNFEGRISFNGQFKSLGLTPQDWVKNFAGSFLIYGQDIAVKGFNLSGVVKDIPSVRSVGDVVNIVRTSLLRRKTSFSVIDAGFYAKDGVIYTTKLKLRSRHAIGNGSGSLDLISWSMNLNTIFKFVTLSNKDMPDLGIHFVDSMDDPVAKLDTRSLEAFVARRKLIK